jgi:hypothetical protein
MELAVVKDSNACAVVPAIFQPAQAVQDDRAGFTLAEVTNNSTHINHLYRKSRPEKKVESVTISRRVQISGMIFPVAT